MNRLSEKDPLVFTRLFEKISSSFDWVIRIVSSVLTRLSEKFRLVLTRLSEKYPLIFNRISEEILSSFDSVIRNVSSSFESRYLKSFVWSWCRLSEKDLRLVLTPLSQKISPSFESFILKSFV